MGLVDGTLIGCANYAGCASKSQWYRGMRLLPVTDRYGAPVGYDLRPANENEREGDFQLAAAHPGCVLFADAGHRGSDHHRSLELAGVELILPDMRKFGQRPSTAVTKARIRLVIQ